MAAWSSGMIPVLGTGGHGFNSRSGPIFFQALIEKSIEKKMQSPN